MAENISEKKAGSHEDQWRERMAAQQQSGLSVRRFCKERGIAEHRFYYWRKRLREQQQPMRFALVERASTRPEPPQPAELELLLASGERLRIATGVPVATLRMVLDLLRA